MTRSLGEAMRFPSEVFHSIYSSCVGCETLPVMKDKYAVLPSPLHFTPVILLPALSFSMNVVGLTVEACPTSLKVTVMTEVTGTFVALLVGLSPLQKKEVLSW